MKTLIAVAAVSALVGGLAGGGVVMALGSSDERGSQGKFRNGTESERSADPTVDRRLADVEQAVRVLQRRGSSSLSALRTPSGASHGPSAGAADTPGGEASLVDDPVFEAAVRDVVERAEADREQERELRREDRRKQMAARVGDELAERLNLDASQKAKLVEIAQSFMNDVSRLFSGRDGGNLPREERRAEMRRLREEAEQKLRGVLNPAQMQSYEALDDSERLGFPRRGRVSGNRDGGESR